MVCFFALSGGRTYTPPELRCPAYSTLAALKEQQADSMRSNQLALYNCRTSRQL